MILSEEVVVRINTHDTKYYRSKGYVFKAGTPTTIQIEDLKEGSHAIISVQCDVCGRQTTVAYRRYLKSLRCGGYYSCSNRCNRKKIVNTCIERYGTDCPLSSKEVRIRIRKTMIERYGVDVPLKSVEILEKTRNTVRERYGVDCVFQSSEIKESSKETFLLEHGVDHYCKSKEYHDRLPEITARTSDTRRRRVIKKYSSLGVFELSGQTIYGVCSEGHQYEIPYSVFYMRNKYGVTPCTVCKPIYSFNQSIVEKSFLEFVQTHYTGKIIHGDRTILPCGLELDVYLPDLSLAFEFNGVYWHSDLHLPWDYHIKKSERCREVGIRLVHVWEDDWSHKREVVESRVLHLLGESTRIGARSLRVVEISDEESSYFQMRNSLYGVACGDVHISLKDDNGNITILGVFSKVDGGWDMSCCPSKGISVPGGISRMIHYLRRVHGGGEIRVEVDSDWGESTLTKVGFIRNVVIPPVPKGFRDGVRIEWKKGTPSIHGCGTTRITCRG